MVEIPVGSQMYEGRGVDSVTGGVFGTALTFEPPRPVDMGTGQQVRFELLAVSSSRELASRLNIDATASFKGAWGVSAEFSLLNSKEVNNYYAYALLRCHVINAPRTIRVPRLLPEARDLLVGGGWEAFATVYGMEYVDGFVEGGAYYGLIEVQTESRAAQLAVKGKLSGHYGPFKLDGSFARELEQIQQSTAINVSVTRSGGLGAPVSTGFDEMIEEAVGFPAVVRANPVPVLALIAEYRSSVPTPTVPAPDSLPRRRQRDVLADLSATYMRLRDYKADLEFVLRRRMVDFDEFQDVQAEQAEQARAGFVEALSAVAAEIDEVVRRGRDCAADPGVCETYVSKIDYLPLPVIGGDVLTLRQLEAKMRSVEAFLLERGVLTDTGVRFRSDVTVGSGGNGRVVTRHVDGKQAGSDAPDALFLNHGSGLPVHVGGAHPSNLEVHGDVRMDGNRTLSAPGRMHIAGDEHLFLLNRTGVTVSHSWGGNGQLRVDDRLGTAGRDPAGGMPPGIHGGVHTFDVVAEGVIGVGPPGRFMASMWSDGAIRGRKKEFVIDHPLHPDTEQLVHASLEGPETGVYYRGEAVTDADGCTRVELPAYFEALTSRQGRTVLVTPLSGPTGNAAPLATTEVVAGAFTVRTTDRSRVAQRFFWEVKAVRRDLEPLQVEVAKP